jgi:hypothetical protein
VSNFMSYGATWRGGPKQESEKPKTDLHSMVLEILKQHPADDVVLELLKLERDGLCDLSQSKLEAARQIPLSLSGD